MKTTNTLANRVALIAALNLGNCAWLSAQTQEQMGQPEGGLDRQQDRNTADVSTNSQTSQLMTINKGSSLIGTTVKNPQGEKLGKIRDLVIDFNSDRVAYVVLDSDLKRRPHPGMASEPTEVMAKPADGKGAIVPLKLYPPGFDQTRLVIYDPAVARWVKGGSSGTGIVSSHQLHAVPLRAFQPDSAGTALILNVDKDNFARSAGFDKNNWPGVTTAAWGAEPFLKDPQSTSGSQERNDLDQQNIQDQQNKENKKIERQPRNIEYPPQRQP